MSTQRYFNNAKTTLSADLGSSDLIIHLVSGVSFPNPSSGEYFLVTIDSGTQVEIIKVTSVSGNTLVINTLSDRGWEGTGAQSFSLGARVECRVTAATLSNIISIADSAMSAEVVSRGAADVAEYNARVAADLVLTNAVASEVISRGNADSTLQININNEASARSTADSVLSGAINTEALARSGSDVLLQTNIDAGKVKVGTIVAHATSAGPGTGYIQLLTSIQYLSNTTYPALYASMATDGFPWGTGSGTFGIPWAKTGYTLVAGTPGTETTGDVKAHTHTYSIASSPAPQSGSSTSCFTNLSTSSTGSTGGTANLPAGTRVTFWIKY